jgi:hypothetical protein
MSSSLQVSSVIEEVDEWSEYSGTSVQYWSQVTRGYSRFESLRNERDHDSLDDYQTGEVFGSVNVVIIATLQRLERGS